MLRVLALVLMLSATANGQQPPASAPGQSTTAGEQAADAEATDLAAETSLKKLPVASPPWRLTLPENSAGPAGPDLFYLPDKTGKLRMVLGFQYEDFLRAWQDSSVTKAHHPPPFVYESLYVDGRVEEETVALRLELTIATKSADWIEVPILLPSLIVRQVKIEDRVDGEIFDFDEQRGGYRVWLKGSEGQRRRIQLDGFLGVTRSAEHSALRFLIPRAQQSSILLRVPEKNAKLTTSSGMVVTSDRSIELGREFRIAGYASPVRLRWTTPEATRVSTVEATGHLTVRLEPSRAIYDAELQINSFGKPLDRVKIRLPKGAKLTTGVGSKELEFVSDEQPNDPLSHLVEVRSQRPRTTPWTLQLTAEQEIEVGDENDCTVGGFEVIGALRQSGTIDLVLDEQLQAYFDLLGDVKQIPTREADSSPLSNAIAASFRYTQFPWDLTAHLVPRKRRLNVTPRYSLSMSSDQAQLNLALDYQLAGARTYALRIDMHDWKLTDDPIESGGVVDSSRHVETQQGLLVLPLANPEAPRVRIRFTARRDTQLGTNSFPLPEPLGAFVTDGQLAVAADASLRLQPNMTIAEGLALLATEGDLPVESTTSLAESPSFDERDSWTFRTFLAQPMFAAETSRRERQVSVQLDSQVNMSGQTIEVLQEFDYRVRFGPIAQLKLRLPATLALNESLTTRLNGQPIAFRHGFDPQDDLTAIEYSPSDPDLGETKPLIVTLPRPLQGSFQLTVGYQMPRPNFVDGARESWTALLVSTDDPIERHFATIAAEPPLHATLNQLSAGNQWAPQDVQLPGERSPEKLHLQSSDSPLALPLTLTIEQADTRELATLEGAWMQSWFSGRQRQDRIVYRFRTEHARTFVRLPSEVAGGPVEVLFDGDRAEVSSDDAGRLTIPIPASSKRRQHVLELRYQQTASLADWRLAHLSLPSLECHSADVPLYWQLVLPRNWHALAEPLAMTGEYWLGWKNLRWGRQPNLTQPDLERWIDASTAPQLPQSTNQYLFRSFKIPEQIELRVVRHFWLLSIGVILAFGIGLVLLYTSLAKRSVTWLILSIALLGLVSSYPEVVLLVVQAILWGGLMTFGSGMLRQIFAPASQRDAPSSHGFSSASTGATTEAWPPGRSSYSADPDDVTAQVPTGGSAS